MHLSYQPKFFVIDTRIDEMVEKWELFALCLLQQRSKPNMILYTSFTNRSSCVIVWGQVHCSHEPSIAVCQLPRDLALVSDRECVEIVAKSPSRKFTESQTIRWYRHYWQNHLAEFSAPTFKAQRRQYRPTTTRVGRSNVNNLVVFFIFPLLSNR